jgi:erythromycin esterase-like protein
MQTQPQTQTPAAAVVVTHEVEDFATWKRAFDRHASARRNAGIFTTHVNRHADDLNRLSVYLGGSDAAALDAFLTSAELKSTMRDAGIKGASHVAPITPVEDMTVKTGALPGLIVRHEVRDFATWKRAFDADASARNRAGLVGHAVNRSRQNPNVVMVYLQAPSLDALKAFAASSDLAQVMQSAGVGGVPDLTFVQGETWAS